ncbi:hypothetical protein ACHAWF_004043 [Thalassiosira exigua]
MEQQHSKTQASTGTVTCINSLWMRLHSVSGLAGRIFFHHDHQPRLGRNQAAPQAWPNCARSTRPGRSGIQAEEARTHQRCDENHIFGKAIARAHTIEFQKRGFPHAHIVCWLAPETGKHMDPDRLDEIICAEIPDKEDDPVLFELVTKFMLHGPCGPEYPDHACMQGRDGFYRFNFSKDFVLLTQLSNNGYPLHRRRSPEEGGHSSETWKNK